MSDFYVEYIILDPKKLGKGPIFKEYKILKINLGTNPNSYKIEKVRESPR